MGFVHNGRCMEAKDPIFSPEMPQEKRPREVALPIRIHVDADADFDYLCEQFEEFLPALRTAVSQAAWLGPVPKGLYEVILPEGVTMPLIKVQYALTEKAIILRAFQRNQLLGSPTRPKR